MLTKVIGWVRARVPTNTLRFAGILTVVALVVAVAAYRQKQPAPQPEQPKVEQPVEKPKVQKKRKPKASKQRHVQQPSQPGWRRGCDANGMCWWYWE